MSLVENGAGLSAADVAAVTGNGSNSWGWGDGSFWLIVLVLFGVLGNNGFGGFGGNAGADVQRGFDQAAVMNGVTAINASLSNAEVSRANIQANTLQAINAMQMAQQNCCCDTRAAIADVKYAVAQENCQDRYEAANNTRDILESQRNGTQAILDKLCQLEMDGMRQNYEAQISALRDRNAAMQTQINLMGLTASQNEQTAALKADNTAQTLALEQYLNPTPVPAYVVANPNCCSTPSWGGCGCGGNF